MLCRHSYVDCFLWFGLNLSVLTKDNIDAKVYNVIPDDSVFPAVLGRSFLLKHDRVPMYRMRPMRGELYDEKTYTNA